MASLSDRHPEITAPVLVSTTATLPTQLLRNIELHNLKAAADGAKASVGFKKGTVGRVVASDA